MLEAERFWNKVDKSGECWIWTAAKDWHGYGCFGIKGKRVLAHRHSFSLEHGPIQKDKCVCHSCDNTCCVNPKHLWIGSNADNTNDMVKKGRHGTRTKPETVHRGESPYNSKLNEAKAKEIRRLYTEEHAKQRDLAKQFGVGKTTIAHIVNGDTWKVV